MSVTITQVRRAVEETSAAIQADPKLGSLTLQTALSEVLGSPTALTLIANSINQKTGSSLEVRDDPYSLTGERRAASDRDIENLIARMARDKVGVDPNFLTGSFVKEFDYHAEAMKTFPPPMNAERTGFIAYHEGKNRNECPFPPARRDLKTRFEIGFDEAEEFGPR